MTLLQSPLYLGLLKCIFRHCLDVIEYYKILCHYLEIIGLEPIDIYKTMSSASGVGVVLMGSM